MPPALIAARCAAFAALIVLAGCGATFPLETPVGHPVTRGITWRCTGGKSFTAHLGSNGAQVHAGGHDYALAHVSGAGARYASGGVTYQELAGGASLTGAPGGPYENCRH